MSRLLSLALVSYLVVLGTPPANAQPESAAVSGEERITLDADGILLSQAVQMIIRNRQVSLVTGETLDQTVTVKFTDIPWRDALSSLLKSHGFTILEEQNVLRVVKLSGESDRPQPRMPLVVRFQHLSAAAARDLLTPMLSPNGRIVALEDESTGGAISVVDVPEVLEMVRNLVPDIDVAPENSSATMTRHDDDTATFAIRNFPLGDLPAALNDQLDLNVFLNTSVSGVVNANLKRVPVLEGLRLILMEKGLDFREQNGVIVVDQIEKMTSAFVTREFRLMYLDAWDVKDYLEPLLSEGGKISCYSPRPRGGFEFGSKITDVRESTSEESSDANLRSKIFTVTAHPRDIEVIAEKLAKLDVMPRQVEVSVKIVQITRNESERTGIDWNTVLSMSGSLRPHNLPFGPSGGKFFPGSFPDPVDSNFIFGTLDATQLTAALNLIHQSSDAEIISEPNITTLDAIEASILIGQKFPVTTETIDPQTAVRTVTLDYYEDIGIQLNVIPSVSGDTNSVHLIIHPAVSTVAELIEDRFPVIQTREADTQVMLDSGDTVVIGGLVENDVTDTQRRVPWLGRIPILGKLFTYDVHSEVTTELVLLVTPRIVRTSAELEETLLLDQERLNELRKIDSIFEEVLGR